MSALLCEGQRLVVPPRSDAERETYSHWLRRAVDALALRPSAVAADVNLETEEVLRLLDRTYNTAKSSRTDVHAYVMARLAGATPEARRTDPTGPIPSSAARGHATPIDRDADDDEDGLVRGFIRTLHPSASPEPPVAYRHQLETLRRLENGVNASPPISGIVHLPTGAGKTRVALEFIARRLAQDPSHRFIWATDAKELISQTMRKTVEFARRFPAGTNIAWYDGDNDLLDDDVHITFITRSQLREVLRDAHMSRSSHPWRARASSGEPTTIIYDECHQLGAEGLQSELGKFYRKVLGAGARPHAWRVIGLSATPVPTREDAHALLRSEVFPLRDEQPSVDRDWAMHVFHRINNAKLIAEGVLCPLNMKVDAAGIFDIPPELLRRIVSDRKLRAPGPHADKDEVMKYASVFNKWVMSDERVLGFLAERLAKNLTMLRKTVVFSPTIDAANHLVAKLNALPGMLGKVAAVHSKMTHPAYAVPNQSARTAGEVLERFSKRGSEPCILVNVEMLTEGFDDPLVRTVVLAKLTLSTNRFWQMIGRGTRGLRAGGTADCYVIDPIKLVRLYDYFAGYQPSVISRPGDAIDDEAEERGQGALDPSVPVVSRAPMPSRISAELRRLHSSVAVAIDAFIGGARLGEQDVVDVAANVEVIVEDGAAVARSGAGANTAETGPLLIHEMIARMQVAMVADLAWLEILVPNDMPEDLLRYWVRKLNAIEQLGLRTNAEYARAEMEGRLASLLSTPLTAHDAAPSVGATAPAPAGQSPGIQPGTTAADVAALCMAVALADGVIDPAEVELAARIMVEGAGVPASAELETYLRAAKPSAENVLSSAGRLAAAWGIPERKKLVRDLVLVAEADTVIHPNEVDVIVRAGAALGGLDGYAEGLLDARA